MGGRYRPALPGSSQATLTAPVLKNVDVTRSNDASKAVIALAERLQTEGCNHATPIIRAVTLGKQKLDIQLDPEAVATATGLNETRLSEAMCKISTAFACKRRGVVILPH